MTTENDSHTEGQPVATVEKRPGAPTRTAPSTPVATMDELPELPPSDDEIIDAKPATKPKRKRKPRKKAAPPKADFNDPADPLTEITRDDGSLQIERVDLVAREKLDGYSRYWVGTMPDSLVQNIDVHGVGFPRFVGICSFDEKGLPDRPTRNGQIVTLGRADVARCIKALKNKVLRAQGTRRGIILNMDDPSYRPNPKTDRPLGEVLYMVRTDGLGFDARDSYPQPLIT